MSRMRGSKANRVWAAARERLRALARQWLARNEDEATRAVLRHLDDRQLKEFGIHSRPPELTKREFP